MSVTSRAVLRLLRVGQSARRAPIGAPSELPHVLRAAGWEVGETISGPRGSIAAFLLFVAPVIGFALGRLLASSTHLLGTLAFAAFVGAALLVAFVNAACGPIVRLVNDGLKVGSREEGFHLVRWEKIKGWAQLPDMITIDLGPESPLVSRYVVIWHRSRSLRFGSR